MSKTALVSALIALRETLRHASAQSLEVQRLARLEDGDFAHLEFNGVLLPTPDLPVTPLGAWLDEVDRFLRASEA